MKQFLTFLFAFTALMANAQSGETPAQKYCVATNSFWSNWFVQADVCASSFFGDKGNLPQSTSLSSGLLKDFRTNLGLSVALGKWFTPGLGLRTKFSGVWGRTVISDDKDFNASKYWTLSEQLLFNFSNMFAGYSDTRRWDIIPYLSAGVGRSMSYDTYAFGLGVGLLNQWRISPKVALNLDIAWQAYEPDFDGAGGVLAGHGLPTKDKIVCLEMGITYNLGRGSFNRIPDTDALSMLSQSQIDALNAQLADEQAENERLRQMINNNVQQQPDIQQQPTVLTELVTVPVSVFFSIGKATIDSRRELQNLADLIQTAMLRQATIVVTGYADSATGSDSYNRQLSLRRAQAVADELVMMGFPENRIDIRAGGGVDELSPVSYNRRAVITIK